MDNVNDRAGPIDMSLDGQEEEMVELVAGRTVMIENVPNLRSVRVEAQTKSIVLLKAVFTGKPDEEGIERAQGIAGFPPRRCGPPMNVKILGSIALWNCQKSA